MLKKIVFLIWDRLLLEKVAELKQNIGVGSENIHIWGRGVRKDGSRAGDEEKAEGDGAESCETGQLKEKESDWIDGEEENGRRGGRKNRAAERGGKEEGEEKEERDEKPDCLEAYEQESTLFITDKGIILQELKRSGRYVIALLYEGNGQEDFAGASYAVTDIEELTMDSFDKAYRRMAGLPWTIFETERCIVRETTVADVDEFYRIYAEPSITYYMDKLYDAPEEEKAYTQEYIKRIYGFYGYGMWSIVQKETGRVIGRAGLSWREGFDIPEIGFVIEASCQRMGYAYEVCSAIVKYGKEELEFSRIQALVEPGNEASAGLCRKLGLEWEDTVEDGGRVYERFVTKC